jgi:hypothetical protein
MPEQGTWRISTAYDYIDDLDPPDVAWEFLRRNPEYQQDYEHLKSQGPDALQTDHTLSTKWGLSFCGRPGPSCNRCEASLDASSRSVDVDPPDTARRDRVGLAG